MALVPVVTSLPTPPNLIYNVYDSLDIVADASFLVENYTIGPVINLGAFTNISGVYYNKFTHRVGFIQNNTGLIYEFTYAALKAATIAVPPVLLRTITLAGLDGDDTEGCSNIVHNYLEGGFENWVCDENGGANRVYNLPWTFDEMFSTADVTITARQRLTMAANASPNEGTEGVSMNKWTQDIDSVQEGGVSPQVYRRAVRPTNRDTSYTFTDPELVVTNPFDSSTLAGDQSDVTIHHGTGHSLILSDTANALNQVTTDGLNTLVSTLNLGATFDQPEGFCQTIGLEGIIASETDSFAFLTYVTP